MKILMIAPQPIFEPRGTPFSVVGRLKALSDMGYKVDLLTYPMGQDINIPRIEIIRIKSLPLIQNVKIGPSWSKIPLDIHLCFKSLLLIIINKYDLIYTHEEAGIWGIFLQRIFHIPHIYDMHSSLPQQFENFKFAHNPLVIFVFKRFEKWALKYSSCVITICLDLYQYVKKISRNRGSILIENTVDYGMIFGHQDYLESIKEQYRLDGKRVILYTGTFEAYQGLELLIQSIPQVVRQMRSIIFLLIGGEPEQIMLYKKLARKKDVINYIHFTGQILPQDVDNYVGCADVLVSPRISGTNTPLKVYNYLRSGVPIVATRLLTHTQVLNEHVAILTDPTPESFSTGILKVLKNVDMANQIGKNARQFAMKEYSYSKYQKRMQEAINQALNRGA